MDTGSGQILCNGMPAHFAESPKTEDAYKMLSVSQPSPPPEAMAKIYRPASVVDKTHIHSRYNCDASFKNIFCCFFFNMNAFSVPSRWLDSSRSLMQQGIKENDKLSMRFKYYTFHDLDPKV